LFAAPPERDLDWTAEGVEGASRFLGRVWNLVLTFKDLKASPGPVQETEQGRTIRRLTHKTIKKVTDDVSTRFHFNTAIAAIMEMTNELGRIGRDEALSSPDMSTAIDEAVRTLVILLSPFVPHIAEELWESLGGAPGLVRLRWPSFDPELLVQDQVLVVVQVNGKKRGEITVSTDASEDVVKQAALAESNVQRFIEGKTIRKTVLVQNKLLNIVVS
jgi:leucyl-tRNA synthetase